MRGRREGRKLPLSFTLNLTETEGKFWEFSQCGMAVQHKY